MIEGFVIMLVIWLLIGRSKDEGKAEQRPKQVRPVSDGQVGDEEAESPLWRKVKIK